MNDVTLFGLRAVVKGATDEFVAKLRVTQAANAAAVRIFAGCGNPLEGSTLASTTPTTLQGERVEQHNRS